jgi:cysteine desulfuration protein SufE
MRGKIRVARENWSPDSTSRTENIFADFELLDNWEDRYHYVIELGRSMPLLPVAAGTEANKVRGCASQVWLATDAVGAAAGIAPHLSFKGDSDSHIVRGLIAILFAIYSGKRADEILRIDAQDVFQRLWLAEHLTPQRSNGFASMVERIRSDARHAISGSASSTKRPPLGGKQAGSSKIERRHESPKTLGNSAEAPSVAPVSR